MLVMRGLTCKSCYERSAETCVRQVCEQRRVILSFPPQGRQGTSSMSSPPQDQEASGRGYCICSGGPGIGDVNLEKRGGLLCLERLFWVTHKLSIYDYFPFLSPRIFQGILVVEWLHGTGYGSSIVSSPLPSQMPGH